ncbi:ATP-binding protein [Streptomyces sp. NPDC101175]|uniref:ATP-binding protein n=1 Tax=Streptomyces sp. NPDC101175 TaxID=3366123 RepID=UPI0038378192
MLVVAEFTANAVRHGHAPGRDFHLRVYVTADSRTVRVEVTAPPAERLPWRPSEPPPKNDGTEESGRGLLPVSCLAARWDWHPRADGPGRRSGRSTRSGEGRGPPFPAFWTFAAGSPTRHRRVVWVKRCRGLCVPNKPRRVGPHETLAYTRGPRGCFRGGVSA